MSSQGERGSRTAAPLADADALSAHLFRLAVVQDGADADAPFHQPDGTQDVVDARSAGERVQDGRRWLGGLLWMLRLVEVGPATPEDVGGAAELDAEEELL